MDTRLGWTPDSDRYPTRTLFPDTRRHPSRALGTRSADPPASRPAPPRFCGGVRTLRTRRVPFAASEGLPSKRAKRALRSLGYRCRWNTLLVIVCHLGFNSLRKLGFGPAGRRFCLSPRGAEGRRGGCAARQAFIPHPGSGPPSPRIGPSGCTIGTPMGDLSRGVLRGKRPRVRREGVYAGGSQGVLTHSPTGGINPPLRRRRL